MADEACTGGRGPCHCANLRRAARAVTRFYDKGLEACGLKVTQFSLLNHLRRLGPVGMGELAQAVRLDRTTLVRNLRLLEHKGFIARALEKGAKGKRLRLTPAGLEALTGALPAWEDAQRRLDRALGPEEFAVLNDLLARLEALSAG